MKRRVSFFGLAFVLAIALSLSANTAKAVGKTRECPDGCHTANDKVCCKTPGGSTYYGYL